MIFFLGNDGTVIGSAPTPVYQGAANVNDIYLVAPFAAGLAVDVAFKLPNGVLTSRYPMKRVNELTGIINKQTGQNYNGYLFSMPNEITRYYGTVTAQFFVYTGNNGQVLASSYASFAVGAGVPSILPPAPSEDVYEAIRQIISDLQKQLENGDFPARSIYAWNPTYSYGANEITYYPDVGTFGAFVKSIAADNLNNPPYNETGVLDSEHWEVVLDFNTLNKAIVIWGFNQAVDISDLDWEVK